MSSFYGNAGGGGGGGGSSMPPGVIAENYDNTQTYSSGDIVYYEDKLYQANTQTTGDFDSTKWTEVSVVDLIEEANAFDLSDRMAKGTDNQGNVVAGAVKTGSNTTASGANSWSQGAGTIASGIRSHAEGNQTVASGTQAHTEGTGTVASGYRSHAEGGYTIANHKSQHVFGDYNIADASNEGSAYRGNYVEIVGNGTDENTRSNARVLDWNGNEKLAGSLTLGMGTVNETTITAAQLEELLSLSSAEGVSF